MKASELRRNHVNNQVIETTNANQEKVAKIKTAIFIQAKSKVQFFLDRMAKEGRDYGVNLEASSFENATKDFINSIPDEVIAKGIFVQCCSIPIDKVQYKKDMFHFCLEASLPQEEESDRKFFPNTLKVQVVKDRIPQIKAAILGQAKSKVKAFLDRMIKDGHDYCVDLEIADFENCVKAFLETLSDEVLSKGIFVQCSSIPDDKVSFKKGVFNFSLETSEPQEFDFERKYCPNTMRVQVINYAQKMQRFYKNRLGLYPSNEFIKSTFGAVDSEGILKLYGMAWDDFLDLLEEKDGDAVMITERVYAYVQENGVYIACCNVPLPDVLRHDEPYTFNVRYVPKVS